MGTFKKLIGIGVVTGVVLYAFLRSMNGKMNHSLAEHGKENAQLV